MGDMVFGLSDDIVAQLRAVFDAQPHIDRVDIFGSRARGDYKPSSDIDLAVYGTADFSFQDYVSLMSRIESLPIVFKVDVVDMTVLDKPALKETIARDGKVFWKRTFI
ncbi:MAG: nucleotidyltransferase domain-containing protein [Alphaproteobacteria bacterium]|nr:nucleotidyltransferase domain-containing protein [Alphaproteobacteria bacterium]